MIPKIHNKYEIEVIDTKTGDKKHYETYNTVTENYRKRLIEQNISQVSAGVDVFFGSGTTAPQPADTQLEAYFGSHPYSFNFPEDGCTHDTEAGIITLSRTIALGTTEYVGQMFSEIGIGNSQNELVSRALFADSEGNPMPIGPKTDTEIFNITVTVYIDLPAMGSGFVFKTNFNYRDFALPLLGGFLNFRQIYSYDLSANSGYLTVISVGANKILKTDRIGKTIANGKFGVNAFPKIAEQNSGIVQKFPNANFAPKTFTNINIGTGDGANKRYGLSTPFYDNGTLSVMVNGLAVPYTITNKCERFPLAFCGMDNVYGRAVKWYEVDGDYQNPVEVSFDGEIEFSYSLENYKNYLIDLGESVKIDYFMAFGGGAYSPNYYFSENNVDFEYISDSDYDYTSISNMFKFKTSKTARYLRASTGGYNADFIGMLYAEHNIELETAPQNGDTVTATWQTSIPSKNENLEYEFTYTFDI